jgi:hypothetical protein
LLPEFVIGVSFLQPYEDWRMPDCQFHSAIRVLS